MPGRRARARGGWVGVPLPSQRAVWRAVKGPDCPRGGGEPFENGDGGLTETGWGSRKGKGGRSRFHPKPSVGGGGSTSSEAGATFPDLPPARPPPLHPGHPGEETLDPARNILALDSDQLWAQGLLL